jgi:hypothetical protein
MCSKVSPEQPEESETVPEPPRPEAAPAAMGPEVADPRSTSEVVRSLTENSQALLRKEIELAKLEITEIVVARAMAIGFAVVGAVLGLFILGFAGVTGAKALELVVDPWLAWLIVTGTYTLLAVVFLLFAKRKATTPSNTPERTKADVEETVEWAKGQVQR